MRAVLTLVLALGLAACAGIPPNAPSTRGTVAYIPQTRELWVDAIPFVLPTDVSDQHIRNGDIVTAFYHQGPDGTRVVTRLEVEERFLWGGPWR